MNKPAKKKLPYLTEEDLNTRIKCVKITIYGDYTKRGDQRKEVFTEDYEVEIVVPKSWNMGHVKLLAQRHVRNELKGIRVRTFNVKEGVEPVELPPEEQNYRRRDFISQQGIMDNASRKREYDLKQEQRRKRIEAEEDGDAAPPAFSDDTDYGSDGLPPMKLGPAV